MNDEISEGRRLAARRLHSAADDARQLSDSLRSCPMLDGRSMQIAMADDMGDDLRREAMKWEGVHE